MLKPKIKQIIKSINSVPHKSVPIASKIGKYADCRVSPDGLVLLQERFDNLNLRYANLFSSASEKDENLKQRLTLESDIQVVCKIKIADILEKDIASTIDYLKSFKI